MSANVPQVYGLPERKSLNRRLAHLWQSVSFVCELIKLKVEAEARCDKWEPDTLRRWESRLKECFEEADDMAKIL